MAKNKIKKYKELCAENSCVFEREEKKMAYSYFENRGQMGGK